MSKNVFGVYDSELQTKSVVEGLIVQGYKEHEIYVVAQGKHITSSFPKETHVEKISMKDDDSVVDKIKHSLLPDEALSPEGVGNRLLELGVSDREAPMYATDIENGRIVVLVDDVTQNNTTIVTTSQADEDTLGGNSYTAEEVESTKESNPFTGIDEESKTVQSGSNVEPKEERNQPLHKETLDHLSQQNQDPSVNVNNDRNDTHKNVIDGAPSYTEEPRKKADLHKF
ncbi:general stress protein [Sutcliffiella deserti]|uniref:general stress protein n=1 Tax=Sutcliffiella deserti TaxID=2875501 RepID=UPI001CBE6B3F|nr:general stress protein [Sutcliffiella deserti]